MTMSTPQVETWILEQCRSNQLRLTRGLREVVRVLAGQRKPISLAQLTRHEELGPHYDTSTLYRVLLRLEEKGLVRRIGFHERSAFFILRAPGLHSHFIVCRNCGNVRALDLDCPVHKLDQDIIKSTGFCDLEHDLSFYGMCPDCR